MQQRGCLEQRLRQVSQQVVEGQELVLMLVQVASRMGRPCCTWGTWFVETCSGRCKMGSPIPVACCCWSPVAVRQLVDLLHRLPHHQHHPQPQQEREGEGQQGQQQDQHQVLHGQMQ